MVEIFGNPGKFVIPVVLILITVLSGWKLIVNYSKEFMPVRYVRVSGVFQYLSKEEIQQAIEPLVMTDFVSVDLQAIHDRALFLPWVGEVRVKRIWPDVIDIHITEQQAVFRWGKEGLLNTQGDLFKPEDITEFDELALIKGPEGHEHRLFDIMQKLQMELMEQSLQIKEFSVNERRSWKIVLEKGMQIQLGRQDQEKKFRRFIQTLQVLGQERIEAIERIDLRYPDGYAVTWKPGSQPNLTGTEHNKHNT